MGEAEHFWQGRYYDFNLRNQRQFAEKLGYIHRNPVKRGLCERPEGWEWSSFRHYAIGIEGRVEIESEWTARKRERAVWETMSASGTAPLKPKQGLNGPPADRAALVASEGLMLSRRSPADGSTSSQIRNSEPLSLAIARFVLDLRKTRLEWATRLFGPECCRSFHVSSISSRQGAIRYPINLL